jgi:hypothetical protein
MRPFLFFLLLRAFVQVCLLFSLGSAHFKQNGGVIGAHTEGTVLPVIEPVLDGTLIVVVCSRVILPV